MKRVLKNRVRRTAIVTLKAGPSFRGVLFEHDAEALVLANVEALGETHATPVDGVLVVLMADVLHLQFP